MPEGHTIHRLAADLVAVFADRTVRASSPQGRFSDGSAALEGARFIDAQAYGKHLVITFARARRTLLLHVHLGLYGDLAVTSLKPREGPPEPWGQVRLRLVGAGAFADLRGPTACELLDPGQLDALIARLGPDPLRLEDDERRAWQVISRSASPIAVLLMRQDVVAGVGNVYRAEVLFRLGIDPWTPGRELARTMWRRIWRDLVTLMAQGVDVGRIDTVRTKHLPERTGRAPRRDRHGGEVYVYRREAQPCLVCGEPIRRAELAARNLFWCPACQSRPH